MNKEVPGLKELGLVYVSDRDPGIRRERRGRGFCYRMPDGGLVRDKDLRRRIEALGIPPAHEKVWICLRADGHLQATGYDARGRKQYRYHPDWRALREEKKYDQLVDFAEALPRIRRRARRDAERLDDRPRAVLGAMTLLLDAAHLRVGNRSYRDENGTFGASTLLKRHLRFGEHLELEFSGKGGRRVRRRLHGPRLQRVFERIADLPGRELFGWREADGTTRVIESGQLNAYLGEISGAGFSAKTFRTWGGTVAAFEAALDELGRNQAPLIRHMAEAAARELSNTPTICRSSYIHPAVLALSNDDSERHLLARQAAQPAEPAGGLRVSESRLTAFLKAARRL
ncbi:DNA topoisomerase IB [Martelella sp. AMO21009]